ncbi:hypothetical protein RB594_006180 [Gaeumannomyces avenae]
MKPASFLPLLAALMGSAVVDAKAVFAHFMVGNVQSFDQGAWENDIGVAQAAGIDAYALNIAAGDSSVDSSLAKAFAAADSKGFKLFFSFDYAAWGAWPQDRVVSLINSYKGRASYYQHNGKPLVSTFEGPDSANQWGSIKGSTNAFFVPDWDSQGPSGAASLAGGVVDGLFNWDSWPVGAADMSTSKDQAYKNALSGKPYMMGVSPWFFTNLPGWNKNWLWRGDDLWFDRWQQVLQMQPEFVEIITWNDWGESHYIAPLDSEQWGLFSSGQAPYNYAADMPHDGWRQFLPYLIRQYKTGATSVDKEGLTTWFRRSPATACATGGTTGNDAGHGQQELPPSQVVQDRVFYSALLTSGSGVQVTVSIGGSSQVGSWEATPGGNGAGMYHGSVPFNGRLGQVVVTITRDGNQIARVDGASISTSCTNGITNWNAWVGGAWASGGSTPPPTGDACVAGSGQGNFGGLCSFACHYDYCPSPCTCTARGTKVNPPAATGQKGYPKVGVADHCAYLGLCSFAWDRGYTDNLAACGSDPAGAAGC